MDIISTPPISVLHVNDAISPGGSVVVMDSLVKSHQNSSILSKVVIAEPPDKLGVDLGDVKYFVLRPRQGYLEHAQFLSKIKGDKKNVRFIKLILYEAKRNLFNLAYTCKLSLIIKRERISVVHIHSAVLPCIACIITNTPYIVHLHGSANKIYSRLGLRLIGKSKKIVAISEFVANTALECGIDTKKIEVIANPVRPSLPPQPIQHSFPPQENGILIGHFGRIVPWKGQLEFIKSFAVALNKTPHLSAILVGSVTDDNDDYLDLLIRTAKELKINHLVHFLGHKNNTQDYYNICDIVVHSSLEPEPFGLVIIEAMAAGKPVIASTLGAPGEIIENGKTGLLVPPNNTYEFERAITRLATSKALRLKLGNNAKKTAHENYRLDFIGKKFITLYQSVYK